MIDDASIYNLDKNGFYGSMLAPESFLPKKNPPAEKALLEHCLKIVQALDPIGTCCRTPEERLLVQARLDHFLNCDMEDTLRKSYDAVWRSIRTQKECIQ